MSMWIIFLSLLKNHTSCEQILISGQRGSVQQKIAYHITWGFSGKNKHCGFREVYLQVMQNIYSPNRVYLTSLHDNSQVFDNIAHIFARIYTWPFVI